MSAVAAAFAIERCDFTKLRPQDLAGLARLNQTLEHERFPHYPLTPLPLIERRIGNRVSEMIAVDWIARSGDEIVGMAQTSKWKSETNPHWRDAYVGVHPDHRRQGHARRFVREIVFAVDDAETIFGFNTNDKAPGEDLAKAVGGKVALTNRVSETSLADIDRGMVREWASIDPAGYRIVWIDGDVPDEHIPSVITAYDLMNTAPRGDLAFGDWHVTAEQIREWERIRNANGGQRRLLLAIEDATGEVGGFTEVVWHPDTPWKVGQNGTATTPSHRGRGLGKWMKARMIERILADWPKAQFISTGNAYVNAPMLSINDRLGFKIVLSSTAWQATYADVKRYLEERGL